MDDEPVLDRLWFDVSFHIYSTVLAMPASSGCLTVSVFLLAQVGILLTQNWYGIDPTPCANSKIAHRHKKIIFARLPLELNSIF